MWCSTCREIRIQFPSEVNNEYFGTCRNCQMTKNQNDNDNNSQNIIILPVEYRHARKPITSRNLDVDYDDSLNVLYEYEPSVTNSHLSRNETNHNKQKHKSRNKNYSGPELRTWEELIELQTQFNGNCAEEEKIDFSHGKDIQEHYRRSNPIYQESSSNINFARTTRQKHALSKLNKYFFDLSISPKTSRKFQDTSTETDADCTACHDSASQTPTYHDASTMPYSGQIDESVSTGSYPQLTGWSVICPKVKTEKSQTDNDNDNENMKTCGSVIDIESGNSMSLLSGTEKQFLKNVKFATVQDEHSEILETDDSSKVVIQSLFDFEKDKQNIEPTTVLENSNLERGDALANNDSCQSEIGEEFSVANDDDKSTVDRFINYLKSNPGLSLQDIQNIVNGLNATNEKKENNAPDLADNCQVDTKCKHPLETISEILETSNAYRSNFQPISDTDNSDKDVPRQFELIKTIFPTTESYSNYKKFTQNKIPSVEELKIIRDPFRCPIANCTDSIFLREIACHIKICHSKTPIQRIRPGKKYSVFIDPKVDRLNLNKCHFLFLLSDKIRNFGKNEFKDYLPVLFMSTKIDLCQLMKIENKEVQNLIANNSEKEEFLAIWLIGFMPTDFRLNYCISAWPRYSKIPECHITRSNWVYSVQSPHDIRNLYKKGQLIMLSPLQCNQLTDDGKNMIEIQIMFK